MAERERGERRSRGAGEWGRRTALDGRVEIARGGVGYARWLCGIMYGDWYAYGGGRFGRICAVAATLNLACRRGHR